tara:strand:+ start:443 stop:904 length:462 start_codon:yes stop_codon:yes gene_type:complete
MQAVKSNDFPLVLELIEGSKTSINVSDDSGNWPLVIASYMGHNKILELLLKNGADVSVLDPSMNATALHAAAYAGRSQAARLLIEYGVEIDKQGPVNGYTALHDAIWQNNIETALIILKGGANKNIKSNQGQTPLDLAKSNGHKELINLLQDN